MSQKLYSAAFQKFLLEKRLCTKSALSASDGFNTQERKRLLPPRQLLLLDAGTQRRVDFERVGSLAGQDVHVGVGLVEAGLSHPKVHLNKQTQPSIKVHEPEPGACVHVRPV